MWRAMYSFCGGVSFCAALVSSKNSEAGAAVFFSFVVVVCTIAAFAAAKREIE